MNFFASKHTLHPIFSEFFFIHIHHFAKIEKFFDAIWLMNLPCLQELLKGDYVVGYEGQIHKRYISFYPAELHLADKTLR
jgi:hypothetical protein